MQLNLTFNFASLDFGASLQVLAFLTSILDPPESIICETTFIAMEWGFLQSLDAEKIALRVFSCVGGFNLRRTSLGFFIRFTQEEEQLRRTGSLPESEPGLRRASDGWDGRGGLWGGSTWDSRKRRGRQALVSGPLKEGLTHRSHVLWQVWFTLRVPEEGSSKFA